MAAAATEEVEMLRLQLDVNCSDDLRRDQRVVELERRLAEQARVLDEYLGAMGTICSYLVTATERLRASS